VLHTNYRGSTGFGQDSIESLLGNIGRNDVDDVCHCTEDAIGSVKMSDIDR
jgi:acylaminoacyl-peptidase